MGHKYKPGHTLEKPGRDSTVKYVDPPDPEQLIPEQPAPEQLNPKQLNPKQQSRRDFLEGAGATVVAGAGVSALGMSPAAAQPAPIGSRTVITVTVNGIPHTLEVDDRWTLAEFLRDTLDLTGTKIGCNRGECGACTVLMDDQPVYSCSQLAVWADGARIETVEGLAQDGELSPVQQAFVVNNGAQCGFCTPGQLMTATALLNHNPAPTTDEVREALVGNLCRCSNYNSIVEAVLMAAGEGGAA